MKPGHLPYFNNLSAFSEADAVESDLQILYSSQSFLLFRVSLKKNNSLHLYVTKFCKRVGKGHWKENSAQHLEAAEPALPNLLPGLESAVHPADSGPPRFQRSKIRPKKC